MLNSFLEEACLRAREVEAELPFGDEGIPIKVPREVFVLVLAAAAGNLPLNAKQRGRLVCWADSVVDACELDALDHDTLRHLVGLRRPFGRGGRPPEEYTGGRDSECGA